MINKLNEKDIRALKLGGLAAVIILLFVVGTEWRDSWAAARIKGDQLQAKLDAIDVDKIKEAGLASIVPVFEMLKAEDEQSFLFRDKLSEQLKKAGINFRALLTERCRTSGGNFSGSVYVGAAGLIGVGDHLKSPPGASRLPVIALRIQRARAAWKLFAP